MKDAPKKLFILTLTLLILVALVRFVSLKGLPPPVVHTLESVLDWGGSPFNAAIKNKRPDLSVLLGSQRKQQQAINDLSNQLQVLPKTRRIPQTN